MRGLRGSSLPAPFPPSLNNRHTGRLLPQTISTRELIPYCHYPTPFPSLNLVNSESDNPLSFGIS